MNEKPREKFLRINDPKKMVTEELLSLLIGHGSAKTDVYQLSTQIADYLRSTPLELVTISALKKFDGVGDVLALRILSALEIGRRYHNQNKQGGVNWADWDFENLKQSERQYGTHFFHHYTAKFIPQIPSRLIEKYSKKNQIVIDPFMGSGTTLIEAKLLGRHSYGLDTNPLSYKISSAKTLQITKPILEEIDDFINWLLLNQHDKQDKNKIPPCLVPEVLTPWFREDVRQKISRILVQINRYSTEVQNFLEIGLSNLLKGMSNARMDSVTPLLPTSHIYTDRKHYYREVNNNTREIPVFKRLLSQIKRMKAAIIQFNLEVDNNIICKPMMGDARMLSSFVNYCDLVVTSPPYWSAKNYEAIHKLSIELFGLKTDSNLEIGRKSDSYLDDINQVVKEVGKILHGYLAIVIGHDEKKKSHTRIYEMILDHGFKPEESITRKISNQVSVSKAIKEEYIYVFKS